LVMGTSKLRENGTAAPERFGNDAQT